MKTTEPQINAAPVCRIITRIEIPIESPYRAFFPADNFGGLLMLADLLRTLLAAQQIDLEEFVPLGELNDCVIAMHVRDRNATLAVLEKVLAAHHLTPVAQIGWIDMEELVFRNYHPVQEASDLQTFFDMHSRRNDRLVKKTEAYLAEFRKLNPPSET